MERAAKHPFGEDRPLPPWLRFVAAGLLAAVVVVAWGPRLFWGLGLDETFSAWQAEGGWSILRTKLDNPGQSVLFGYIEALFYFPGTRFMELGLRVPVVLGALASAYLVYRLAESFAGRGAGPMALVPFVGNPDVIRFATEARPYTLATAACLASLWGLDQWLEHGRRRHLLLFSCALALVPYLHLLYVVFGLVPAVLVMVRAARGARIDWRGLGAAVALTTVLLLPLVPFIRDFMARSAALSFQRVPTWGDLFESGAPWTVLFAMFGLLLLAARLGKRILDWRRERDVLVVSLLWLSLPPLLLFGVSRITRQSVLVDRYLLHTVAAQALIIACLYARAPRDLVLVVLLASFVPLPLVFGVRDWRRADGFNSFRAPFATVRALDPEGTVPLFVQAGHPLSNLIDWPHLEPRRSFHYSPLTAYPVANRVYPLPADVDAAMESFMRALAVGELARSEQIFFVGETRRPMAEWFRGFFEARGFQGTYAFREGLGVLALRRVAPAR